jgi:hypothetical protein
MTPKLVNLAPNKGQALKDFNGIKHLRPRMKKNGIEKLVRKECFRIITFAKKENSLCEAKVVTRGKKDYTPINYKEFNIQ